ncbi:unnamed protein product, partial [Brugia timori]|uniref:Pecanex-like protein n=1 Tax=Brugia timori TaxID=42155 RepID=A0A0R3QF11_9BILA
YRSSSDVSNVSSDTTSSNWKASLRRDIEFRIADNRDEPPSSVLICLTPSLFSCSNMRSTSSGDLINNHSNLSSFLITQAERSAANTPVAWDICVMSMRASNLMNPSAAQFNPSWAIKILSH